MDNNEPEKKEEHRHKDHKDNKGPMKFNFGNNRFALLFLITLIMMFLVMFVFNDSNSSATEISYTSFLNYVEEDKIESVKIFDNQEIQGNMRNGSGRVIPFKTRIPYFDDNLLVNLEESSDRCRAAETKL
jgi:cell division protease FtsH